jgi:hypothetical protein
VDEKGKISKESQALLKGLEVAQQSYNENLKPSSSLEPESAARLFGDETELSHTGVLSVVSCAPACGIVRLVRNSDEASSSVTALCDRAVDGIMATHGPIGWYLSSETDVCTSEANTTNDRYAESDDVSETDVAVNDEGQEVEEAAGESNTDTTVAVKSSIMDTVGDLGPEEKSILSNNVLNVNERLLL